MFNLKQVSLSVAVLGAVLAIGANSTPVQAAIIYLQSFFTKKMTFTSLNAQRLAQLIKEKRSSKHLQA